MRTTETGGIRIIYNGKQIDGKCMNTTKGDTQIGASVFNTSNNQKKYVGYIYGNDANPYQNTNDSEIKKYIDNWYKTNIKDKGFEEKLDKTSIYCGDRTEGKVENSYQHYVGHDRLKSNHPSLYCPLNDSYGVNAGNKKLNYPVGLLTSDEQLLAGQSKWNGRNQNYYLYTGSSYWLLSPNIWLKPTTASMITVSGSGSFFGVSTNNKIGVRPVVTLNYWITFKSGDGSQNNPYII